MEIATVTVPEYLDLGLTNDQTYSYALLAVDTHGNRSARSAPVPITPTDLTPPGAPTGVVAVRGDGRVDLTWSANPEPDLADYRVMRDGVEVATVTGATGHADVGLTNDTTYRYTLAAVDTHGNHSISSSPVFATPTDLGAPAAPTGLAAVAGDGQVTLSWTANTEPDIAGYRVLRDGATVATVTGTAYTDTGLTDDTTYAYALVAVDSHGNTSPVSASVPATPTDRTPPAVPTGLAVAKVSGRSVLSWTANTEPDLATYRVLRDGVEIATVTGTTYTDNGAGGAPRPYALVAVDTHGNRSAETAQVTAHTDLTPPAAPTGLTATRGDGQVTLAWAANSEPDLADYRVFRDGVEIATVPARTYVDTGLTNDVTYSYTLVAVDDSGQPVGAVRTGDRHPDRPHAARRPVRARQHRRRGDRCP